MNLKKNLLLLLVCLFLLTFSTPVFASNQSNLLTENNLPNLSIVFVPSENHIYSQNTNELNYYKNISTKAFVCCTPGSPKKDLISYEHKYYSKTRCDWSKVNIKQCLSCNAIWETNRTSPKKHTPGSGYYCPY